MSGLFILLRWGAQGIDSDFGRAKRLKELGQGVCVWGSLFPREIGKTVKLSYDL